MATPDDTVTTIAITPGTTAGAMQRTGLSADQIAGRACLHCGEADDRLSPFGWIGDHRGALHEYCLGRFRGEFRGRE